jgi:hypothetical protein
MWWVALVLGMAFLTSFVILCTWTALVPPILPCPEPPNWYDTGYAQFIKEGLLHKLTEVWAQHVAEEEWLQHGHCKVPPYVDLTPSKSTLAQLNILLLASEQASPHGHCSACVTSSSHSSFLEGDEAIYHKVGSTEGPVEVIKIIGVHRDDPDDVYYTICFANGKEKQMIGKHLHWIVACDMEEPCRCSPHSYMSVSDTTALSDDDLGHLRCIVTQSPRVCWQRVDLTL